MDDEVPILDEENYSTWIKETRVHLKEMGVGIWKETIGGSVSLKHILKLKEMIKEQKEINKTQVEEKEEETTRLNNEKEERDLDDEISKSFETIVHLKTQIEEVKRIEELLKNQINEKEESCCVTYSLPKSYFSSLLPNQNP